MSSGLPSILSSGTVSQPTSFTNPFTHFNYIFGQPPQQPPNFGHQTTPTHPNRLKIKRHRQRVDAGEPRNTYQGTNQKSSKTESMMQIESMNNIWGVDGQQQQQPQPQPQPTQQKEPSLAADVSKSTSDEWLLIGNCGEQSGKEKSDEDDFPQLVEQRSTTTENGDESVEKDAVDSRESPSSTSSASKRKSFMPQKIEEQLGIDFGDEPEQINISVGNSTEMEISEENDADDDDDVTSPRPPTTGLSALQAQLNTTTTPNAASNLFETQKKFYAALFEQQRKLAASSQSSSQDKKLNYEQLVQTLKSELFDNLTNSIEKVVKDWAIAEIAKQQQAASAGASSSSNGVIPPMPFPHPIFPLAHNPLAQFQLHNQQALGGGGGIFPPNLNPFNQLQAFHALRRNMEANNDNNLGEKRKRPKLSDHIKKEERARTGSPPSARVTPPTGHTTPNLSRYFPPTMVGHGMYNGGHGMFGHSNDREDSPTNSDENSECGYDGIGGSTLTPMHLRKAKLMFFYTRYPNSNVLKTYFPDIRFNKNNTAQLVKWFSNFREFYYIQMEKFGRQLLAEGVKSREEIFVTMDSELFKVLNTHYNRNNHIRAPDRLVFVVQETLREFYDAIRLGKDVEPSWKKTIYKIINRMDDPIPDFFKEPNFLERLEN